MDMGRDEHLSRYPGGQGADLPVVGPIFEKYVASHGLEDRLTFAQLDFFKRPFPKADVVILGHSLHDWDLPTKRMLLAKATGTTSRPARIQESQCRPAAR